MAGRHANPLTPRRRKHFEFLRRVVDEVGAERETLEPADELLADQLSRDIVRAFGLDPRSLPAE